MRRSCALLISAAAAARGGLLQPAQKARGSTLKSARRALSDYVYHARMMDYYAQNDTAVAKCVSSAPLGHAPPPFSRNNRAPCSEFPRARFILMLDRKALVSVDREMGDTKLIEMSYEGEMRCWIRITVDTITVLVQKLIFLILNCICVLPIRRYIYASHIEMTYEVGGKVSMAGVLFHEKLRMFSHGIIRADRDELWRYTVGWSTVEVDGRECGGWGYRLIDDVCTCNTCCVHAYSVEYGLQECVFFYGFCTWNAHVYGDGRWYGRRAIIVFIIHELELHCNGR